MNEDERAWRGGDGGRKAVVHDLGGGAFDEVLDGGRRHAFAALEVAVLEISLLR